MPTQVPTATPTSDAIHAEITFRSPERKGQVLRFSDKPWPVDALVWGDAFELVVKFTGDEPRDALVTVRVCRGDGRDHDDVSGFDVCGEIATIWAIAEPVTSGAQLFARNMTLGFLDVRTDYRLSLIWMPIGGSQPVPPATYTCTGEFAVVNAHPTRRPTTAPSSEPPTTLAPTSEPSVPPSNAPSTSPSPDPTAEPSSSMSPTTLYGPSSAPTHQGTYRPSPMPSTYTPTRSPAG